MKAHRGINFEPIKRTKVNPQILNTLYSPPTTFQEALSHATRAFLSRSRHLYRRPRRQNRLRRLQRLQDPHSERGCKRGRHCHQLSMPKGRKDNWRVPENAIQAARDSTRRVIHMHQEWLYTCTSILFMMIIFRTILSQGCLRGH